MASPAPSSPSGSLNWQVAFAIAAAGHVVLGAAILVQRAKSSERLPDPVMIVELPAGAAPAPSQGTVEPEQEQVQPVEQALPDTVIPRLPIPRVETPMSSEPVAVPTPPLAPQRVQPQAQTRPQPAPARSAPAPLAAPAATPGTGTTNAGSGAGENPRAKAEQADWIALVNNHLARRKRYPQEARRAGQEGTPSVRFTVDRRGRVSNVSIVRSSGHQLLDETTVQLVQRTAPFPAMPRSMQRDSITITLPIEYALDRD
ncbi:energy transducer TonB [Aurantiacibacter suaedae]|uniref:energy transducer TonB n=1 Tax=Aurantiacibacter suaedae TaxID=2545755 RepID=UPI0010F8C460|nr:energy transducer TonB [Aurantiacibacter suaedae]